MKRIDIRIDVRVGPAASLLIEADSNLQARIHSEVSGNTLRIWSDTKIRSSNGVHLIYTTPQLKKINISGSGRLVASGFKGDDFSLEQRGSMKSELSGTVARFDVANSGSGSISASGSGRVTVHGDPARRTLSGKRVRIVR
ncbi:GIN domain-containing protein [Janthinobacterium sp. LB3P112]|uniref:GIN domain-containing protein n=1 Tax=Janthinobacterium sp. LB3P112 TaxID=3424196 RepID=UPI003F21C428